MPRRAKGPQPHRDWMYKEGQHELVVTSFRATVEVSNVAPKVERWRLRVNGCRRGAYATRVEAQLRGEALIYEQLRALSRKQPRDRTVSGESADEEDNPLMT